MARLAPSARRARTALRAKKVRAFGCPVLRLRFFVARLGSDCGSERFAFLGCRCHWQGGRTGERRQGRQQRQEWQRRPTRHAAFASPPRHVFCFGVLSCDTCTHGARGRTHRNRVGFGCMPVYSHGHGSLRCVGVACVHIRGCGTQLKLLHRSQGSMCRRASLASSRLNAAACWCAG